MLDLIGNHSTCEIRPDSRYNRDEKEDLKKGIDMLYNFKEDLKTLHPNVYYVIQRLLTVRETC